MRKTTLEEVSAGGVVYRQGENGVEFLIGKHSGYHKWVLPKGLVERGESQVEAALREVEEEVGVRTRVDEMSPLKTIEYWYYADLGQVMGQAATDKVSERRVKMYQEEGGKKTRIHKRVVFYLMELEEDLQQAGWEMEEREWLEYEAAKERLAFESEREVLEEAWNEIGASGQN